MKTPPPRGLALVAVALVLQAGALAGLGVATARLERALDRSPAPAEMPRPLPATPPAPAVAAPPSVASLGDRVVYASADGRLIVLKKDQISSELVIDRVYSLEKDENRYPGDDPRRAYSSFYLVDVDKARQLEINTQEGLFADAIARAPDRQDGLDRCIDAARHLAEAGGTDKLRRRLEDRNPFARHAAAIALGEKGYLAAIPDLVQIVEGIGDTDLARRVILVLRDLTGLPIEPGDGRSTVAVKVDEWWRRNAPTDPYARRVSAPR